MFNKRIVSVLLCLAAVLCFSVSGAVGANILFISAMDDATAPGDDMLKAFIEGLGHTVTYFDDGEDEATTETAAAEADLMVITECWGWDEMGLTLGGGAGQDVATTEIEIVEPGHPLAAGLTGTVSVLTDLASDRGTARFGQGMAGGDATVIATATLADGQSYDVIFVYEKGAELPVPPADGSARVAADIRVCLGFDERSYLVWNENALALLEAAINFGLGIRPQPESYSPKPANGKTEVPRDVVLSWKAGTYAETHDVYFGTNFDDVNDASISNWQTALLRQGHEDTSYALPDPLEFGQTYYWRVDEVNAAPDSTVYKGDVWSFTTLNFFVMDDFEDYNDYSPDIIYETWVDGWDVEANGCIVGYDQPPAAEQEIVHGGDQSMPISYDNNMKYSEAVMTLAGSAKDWTREGIETLSIWFKGYPAYVGGFVEDPTGTYTMTGAGVDIWDNADQFHFAFKEFTGAGSIIAKVESVENTHPFAKAGVMIRDTLEANSRYVGVFVTPENGVRFQYRNQTDGSTDRYFEEGITAPYWVKLERTAGGLVRAYHSADGTAWTRFDLIQVSMDSPMYAGLAVTSHEAALTCEAVFSNVSLPNTNADPQWTDQDIGMSSNEAEPMYVALNGSAIVYHDDPAATQIDTWTQWTIPLQAFADQGVDLANIDTIAIGFGDKNNLQPGGSGTIFFDDIRLYRPEATEVSIIDGLVHQYTFDDGTANDSVGQAHGTLIGDASIVDGSLVLDGDGDWMDMPGDIIALNTFSELSIEVRFTSVAGGNTGFHMLAAFGEEGTGADPGFGYKYLFITPARGDDVSRVAIQTSSMDGDPWSEETGVSAAVEHDDGLEHHFVCTVNATDITFYIDGELIGSAALAEGNEIAGIGTAAAHLGKGVYNVDPLWTGSVDEFNIYNRVLSGEEVRALANSE
jgi:hypothetical protein